MAQKINGPIEDVTEIQKKAKLFSEILVSGNSKAAADAYTSDGKIFPNNMDIIEGTSSLKDYWKPRNNNKIIAHAVYPEEISVVDNTAYDYGYYKGKSINAQGIENEFSGKYVIVWKKVENDWKMYLDIWNRRAPNKTKE